MLSEVELAPGNAVAEYEPYVFLAPAVEAFRRAADAQASRLGGRTVWMVNSTAKGGGVAEMLPQLVALLREVGVDCRWLVAGADEPVYFDLTKRLHNMIHGHGAGPIDAAQADVYEAVSAENGAALSSLVKDGDVLVVHDPQPAGAGARVLRERDVVGVWRCHIGLDHRTEATDVAWSFLLPWIAPYQRVVFSLPEYIPEPLRDRAVIVPPSIDPLSHKNRELTVHKLTGVLSCAGLLRSDQPSLGESFPETAQRLQANGSFGPALEPDELGLLFRPIVTQVSRWDRLKGFGPLLEAFRLLKERQTNGDARHAARIRAVRLMMCGPDPSSVADDPEGKAVLDELMATWVALPEAVQADVAILVLPMGSRKHNALMVNAIQRCSTLVVQNSIREGFGLTATEAMWKGCAVLASSAAGLRAQVRHELDGRIVDDPSSPYQVADALDEMLSKPRARSVYGLNGRRRVMEEFLVLRHAARWLEVLGDAVG
ncbi:MAG: glycosyltransferase [Sandaracinaceae bacterium]